MRSERTLRSLCLLLLCSLAAGARAGDEPLQLIGPEVFKVDRNTRGLTAADVDGNGLRDLVLINNERATIDLLLQLTAAEAERRSASRDQSRRWRPQLSDARLHSESVPTGNQMYAVAVGDLDGDGRMDLIFTGKPDGLTVRFQDEGGRFERRQVFELEPNQHPDTLLVADLDGDGRKELLVLGQRELLVLAYDRHRLTVRGRYPLADAGSFGPRLLDVDGDGRSDLVYAVPNSAYALRLRTRRADGGFGPEQVFRLDTPRSPLQPLRTAEHRTTLAAVQAKTALLSVMSFAPSEPKGARAFEPLPYVHALATEVADASQYAIADVDGDGLADLLVADHKRAALLVYHRERNGGFIGPQQFPTLADVRHLAAGDIDGDGKVELFLASQSEEVVGESRMDSGGRPGFPKSLPLAGKPLGLAYLAGKPASLAVLRRHEKRLSLVLMGMVDGGWKEQQVMDLGDESADPRGLAVADLDQDGRPDLLLLWSRRPAWLFRRGEDGRLARVEENQNFRRSLLDNLSLRQLTVGDVDGDGKPELLVAGRGYVRALRLTREGSLEVVEQINSVESEADVSSAVLVDSDGDGRRAVLMMESRSDKLHLLRRDPDRVFRSEESFSPGKIEPIATFVLDHGKAGSEVLYLDRDRFWLVPIRASSLAPKTIENRESDLEEMKYRQLAAGDLDGDGTDELVVLDNERSHILEVLEHKSGKWRPALHFTIFDELHQRKGEENNGRAEPRELLVTDLTGDGHDDIVLLVHDRVLLYPSRGGSDQGAPRGTGTKGLAKGQGTRAGR